MPLVMGLSRTLLLLLASSAPAADTIPATPRSWLVLPIVVSAPETGFGGGALVGWYEGGGVGERPSSVLTDVVFTAKEQVIFEVIPELYLGGGRTRVAGGLRALEYPDVFHGVGNGTGAAMEESFTSRTVAAELAVERELRTGLWIGALLLARHDRLLETEPGGLLESGAVAGSEGGSTRGAGFLARLDTRANRFVPRNGTFAELRLASFGGALGSDYRFDRASLDVRRFLPVGARSTVALRGRFAAASGDVPLQEMPGIGGQGTLRGYRDGRFRDRGAAALEAELRVPLAWRLGLALFGGIGDVASSLSDVPAPRDLERALGAGLRLRVNEGGVNIRVDYARGREGGALYLGMGEAF